MTFRSFDPEIGFLKVMPEHGFEQESADSFALVRNGNKLDRKGPDASSRIENFA